jgi:hypothetical protein
MTAAPAEGSSRKIAFAEPDRTMDVESPVRATKAQLPHQSPVPTKHADSRNLLPRTHRTTMGRLSTWLLVVVLFVGAYVGRPKTGADLEGWVLLTIANAVALALALGALYRARLAPVMHGGILAVFFVGGLSQLYLLSYNVLNPSFFAAVDPVQKIGSPSDIRNVYSLLTLAFVIFCLMVALFAAIPTRPALSRISNLREFGWLNAVLAWGTVAAIAFTAFQVHYGIGRAALYNRSLPFHLVAITLFYLRDLYPAVLLLGMWAYGQQRNRLRVLCLLGIGLVATSQSYIAASRGSIFDYGIPVLFVWFLVGSFTKYRKTLVVVAFVAYLLLAPVISSVRATRVQTTTLSVPTAKAPSSTSSIDRQLGVFLLRVGGTGSMLFALHSEGHLSVSGLGQVYRPSGLTSYFTYQVVGISKSGSVADSQAPTLVGMGMLIGGPEGIIVVLVLTLIGLELAWHWIARKFWSWPVALAILAQAALFFFSEGVTIQLYKELIVIAIIELLYRYIVRHTSSPTGPLGRELPSLPKAEWIAHSPAAPLSP